MNFSSKHLIWFFSFAILFSASVTVYISQNLGRKLASELRDREISLLLGAIEAGPLAIARLHSSALSQDALDRIMTSPSLGGRAMEYVSIVGGAEKEFKFSEWKANGITVDQNCVTTISKVFQYPDALNPFEVRISYNKCSTLSEERQLKFISFISVFIVYLLVSLALVFAAFPLMGSLRKTFLLLGRKSATIDLSEIKFLPLRKVAGQAMHNLELEREAELANQARQVAHDIRGPLSALNLVAKELVGVHPDALSIVQSALSRIHNIAQNLLLQNQLSGISVDERLETVDVSPIIEQIVQEKLSSWKNLKAVTVELLFDPANEFQAHIQPVEFGRLLSNLLDNAWDSIESSGFIKLSLHKAKEMTSLKIQDNGKGIPQTVLANLGKKGQTHGKQGGSGLGVYHAMKKVNEWGGQLTFASKEGTGTTASVSLPKVGRPNN